jgi:hypothetical protein
MSSCFVINTFAELSFCPKDMTVVDEKERFYKTAVSQKRGKTKRIHAKCIGFHYFDRQDAN